MPSFFSGNIANIANLRHGDVVKLQYLFYKHDPYPTVLVSDFFPDGRIAGLNIGYLPFPVMSKVLARFGNRRQLNYYMLKPFPGILTAYRSYRIEGIRAPRLLDINALVTTLSTIRRYRPQEIQMIINKVRQQLSQGVPLNLAQRGLINTGV